MPYTDACGALNSSLPRKLIVDLHAMYIVRDKSGLRIEGKKVDEAGYSKVTVEYDKSTTVVRDIPISE